MISLTSPLETWAHRVPVGWKLAALSGATLMLFSLQSIILQVAALTLALMLYLSAGSLFARSGLKTLRILWPFFAVIVIWHLIEGTPQKGLMIALRLANTVALANFVTMTSRLSDMIDVAAWLLTPFRHIGLKTRALEIAIALVIRFTPLLGRRGAQLIEAWRARSARHPSWRIALPMTVLALDDADHVAEALKARGGIH
ncbi:energy-coupling factor transporter transmembrane component T [Phaeobacter sp. PT47_59]|uniref:energy-coupling factor transporter transmembrane component T family protein n=1 Tax=Phaeobacter sp. PT47_59 TaxID=3029979 RepID=UPI00238078FD|nr:energy-coupling factor transporter transmembrane component T [Phaeobacter sp. PT47_59]MDE4172853.1 energy-coupling factor transporter transmembrane component T [Phaeobacter sp. PT47_59]